MTPQPAATKETEEVQSEGWRPEPGDEVTGTLVDVDVATSTQRDRDGNYPQYPLLRIREQDGNEVLVHAFHQTLQKAILQRRPELGHRIRVKFHGKKPLKSDSTRSVALYSLDLPDTPKKAGSVYDQIERDPARRSLPFSEGEPVAPDIPIDADDLAF